MKLSVYGAFAAAMIGSGCAQVPLLQQYSMPTACTTNYPLANDSRLVSIITKLPPGTMRYASGNGLIEYRSELSLRPKNPIGANSLIATGFVLEVGNITYKERVHQRELSVEAKFKYSTGKVDHVLLCESTDAKKDHTEKQDNMHFLGIRKAESALLSALQSIPPIQAPPPSPGFRIALITQK
jgi:hypothetical protein